MTETELLFFLSFENTNFRSPVNEFFQSEKIIMQDNKSAIIFTCEALYVKYKIKTLDEVFKGNFLFGGEYITTPKYREYFLRIRYNKEFKSKMSKIIELKKRQISLDKEYPDGKVGDSHKYDGIGGWGLNGSDGSCSNIQKEIEKLSKKLAKNNELFLFFSEQDKQDSIQFTRVNNLIPLVFSNKEEEVCIFDFDVNNLESFLFYFMNEIISSQSKYIAFVDFNLFEIDIARNLIKDQNQIIKTIDTNQDGLVDLNDNTALTKILQRNQILISTIDKSFIQKFVKLSNYLNIKKNNIQNIFEQIKLTNNKKELDEHFHLLQNLINTYNNLLFHGLTMITSLIDNDLVTFYEIYETFDKLGVFNSNWENEVSEKLKDISEGISDIILMIDKMESNIVQSLYNLTYITADSFSKLNTSVTNQLKSVDSLLRFNNLLSAIQTYQVYKINKNTKGLSN